MHVTDPVPPGFHEVPGGIAYGEALPVALRVVVLVMGLCMCVVPVPFLLHARWGTLSISTLLAGVGVVAPVVLGMVFVRMALGATRQMFFDASARVLHVYRRGPLGRLTAAIPFEAVTEVDIGRNKGLDEPDSFHLCLEVRGRRRPYVLGVLAQEDDALRWRARLLGVLGR